MQMIKLGHYRARAKNLAIVGVLAAALWLVVEATSKDGRAGTEYGIDISLTKEIDKPHDHEETSAEFEAKLIERQRAEGWREGSLFSPPPPAPDKEP